MTGLKEMGRKDSLPKADKTRLQLVSEWFCDELRWLVRVLLATGDRFYWDNGFSRAASLAYTSLASLVPAIALAFGILASFAVSNQHIPQVREFLLKQFVPNSQVVDRVIVYLTEFSDAISSLNVLVIGFLVITSLLLINSVEYVLNETWQVFEARPIAHRLAIFSSIILIAPVLLISAFYFTKFRVEPLLFEIGMGRLESLYQALLPFFIDFSAFLLLYYLVPKAPVRFRSALFGACVAGILFHLAKAGFAFYLVKFSSYDKIYQTLAVIPVSLLWLYLAWTIVLFGAEASYQAQYLPRSGKVWRRSVLSVGDARLVLAVQSLVLVAKAFLMGDKPYNSIDLAEKLGCSSVVLRPALNALEKAGIISHSDSRDMSIMLMRSPDKIALRDIKEALFGDRAAIYFSAELGRFYGCLRGEHDLSKVSLAQVLGNGAT